MILILIDDAEQMGKYLRLRDDLGLTEKRRKHLFVTGNSDVIGEIYSNLEFQYHAHSGERKSRGDLAKE